MPARFAFLPDARTSLTAAAEPASTGTVRRRVDYDIEVQANGARAAGTAPAELSAQIFGAGDITMVDPQVVSAVEPRRRSRGFEPNYFPYVEFVDADFPWRYSLDTRDNHRIQPWIALVALQDDEFEYVEQGVGPLPRIRVLDASRSLPDPDQLWASAHVHVDRGTDASTPISTLMANDPSAHLSRVLCLRKLDERVRYTMFLVPSYEAGRLAGLGSRSTAAVWDDPAWDALASTVDLPYYFDSTFTTSALEDFELVMRRLRPVAADDIPGFGEPRIASAADPGFYAGFSDPGNTFAIQAALQRPGTKLPAHDTNPDLASRLATTLTEVIEGESVTSDGPDQDDPLVAMPPYGWRFRQETEVSTADVNKKQWFNRLNLDLKLRQVAGLGAEIVRVNQESFMADAWDQYQEIVEANRRLARLQAAKLLVRRFSARRVEPLPSSIVLSLQQPLHALLRVDDEPLPGAFAAMGVPRAFISLNLRKVASKRPVKLAETIVERAHVPMPSIPGDRTADLRFEAERSEVPALTAIPAPNEVETPAIFAVGAFTAVASASVGVAVRPFRSELIVERALTSIKALPGAKAKAIVQGLTDQEAQSVAPVMRAPRITRHLGDLLRGVDGEALLAGVEQLPNNTVTLVEENRAFVEALLVGANHAMNNELRWREFPTDMRGTVLARFWTRGYGADDPRGDDIPAIHTWTNRIGQNFAPHDDGEADLVLTIRGDIIRKLGGIFVEMNEATSDTWKKGSGVDHEPVFSGMIGDDVVYFGFSVARAHVLANLNRFFFVIYEPMGRLRFGLDIGTATVRRNRFSMQKASLPFEMKALSTPRAMQLMPAAAHLKAVVAAPAKPPKWDDLSWSHVRRDAAEYLDVDKTSVSVSTGPDLWSANRNSASIARSVWQKPVAAVLPARRVL